MNKINFIEQPYHSQKCGQTCLSMITGKSIDKICKYLGKDWLTSIESDLQNFLNRNGYKTRLISGKNLAFKEVTNNSIVRVCYPNGSGHFVLKTDNKIFDPSVGIIFKMLAYVKITHYLTFEKL
ncbi:hypothetical protein CXF68_17720 [Tenacibaculum sp. Bg11-29]|nr:hypothetical protein CXF68_17720 [Tenacibaculum sp. Bg11-29]